jgi:hypothetical protein
MFKPDIHLIICGDININYLEESKGKNELNYLLNSFNLSSIIYFPTRITKNSRTAIDNIFIDIIKVEKFITSPLSNGLSDHDAQILEIYIHNSNSVCREANNNIRTMRKIINILHLIL